MEEKTMKPLRGDILARVESSHTYRLSDGNGEPIAECKLLQRYSETWWIASLWVHPDHRQQGYATILLDEVVREWGGIPLYLMVQPYTDQPVGCEQLHAWYSRCWGFDATDVPGVLKREEDE